MIRILVAVLLVFAASANAGAVEANFKFAPAEFDLRIAPQDVVEDAQEALHEFGYLETVDGVYGPRTRLAIAEFQEGIEREATGELTRLQFDALVSILPEERQGAVSISPSTGITGEAYGRGNPELAAAMARDRCEKNSQATDCVTFQVDGDNWLVVLQCMWSGEPRVIAMKSVDMITAEQAAIHQASASASSTDTVNDCEVKAVIHAKWGREGE